MKRLMGIMMACGLAFGVSACDKKEAGTTTTTTETKPADTAAKPADMPAADKPADTAAKPADEAKPADTAAAAPSGGIGVAECDEYIKKMTECSTKMAPEAAGPMKESMATMEKAWADASKTPEGKAALASGCKQALDAAKSAYASMGCTF
jgi:hypothetical protein